MFNILLEFNSVGQVISFLQKNMTCDNPISFNEKTYYGIVFNENYYKSPFIMELHKWYFKLENSVVVELTHAEVKARKVVERADAALCEAKTKKIAEMETFYISSQVIILKNGKDFILPLCGDFYNIIWLSKANSNQPTCLIYQNSLTDGLKYKAVLLQSIIRRMDSSLRAISEPNHLLKEKTIDSINSKTTIADVNAVTVDVFQKNNTLNMNTLCEDLRNDASTSQEDKDWLNSKREVLQDQSIIYHLYELA